MQTILGSGGAVGTLLAKELFTYTSDIRLVARNPKAVNATDQLWPADLTNKMEVEKAVSGSAIVYLTIGIEYKTKVWQRDWPVIMQNVLDACIQHNAKLVFFDNTYMYDENYLSNLTEDTPVNACSKKGEVREKIADMLMKEIHSGKLVAMIVRAADFIATKNSVIVEMVYKNFAKGKKANWMGDVNKIHSFTYTPDAAKATALLGNTPEAYNQVWHLPSINTLTSKQWIELFASEMDVAPRYSVLPKVAMSVLGIFVPVLKEFKEMVYQYELDYGFNSSKFQKVFHIAPTAPADAVRGIIAEMKKT